MDELSDVEKKLALLVIREMDKNVRSLRDLERGADSVLKVFREVTAPPRPRLLKRAICRLLFPFSTPIDLQRPNFLGTLAALDEVPADCLKESFVTTAGDQKALVRYRWGHTPRLVIVRIQVMVELERGAGFDTIAGEMAGPFENQAAAEGAGLKIAESWLDLYIDRSE